MDDKVYKIICTRKCRRILEHIWISLITFVVAWGFFVAYPEYVQRDLGNNATVEVIGLNKMANEYKVGITYGMVYSEEWRAGSAEIGDSWTELQGDSYKAPTTWKRTVWWISFWSLIVYLLGLGILGEFKHIYYINHSTWQ